MLLFTVKENYWTFQCNKNIILNRFLINSDANRGKFSACGGLNSIPYFNI